MVNKERLDILLQEVIQEARALKIPVPSTIEKNVIVNGRPKKRFGCCRKSRNGFEIEVSRFLLDEAGCSEKIVKGVLAHEVLHTCRDCYEHGMLWKSYAGQMNNWQRTGISVTLSSAKNAADSTLDRGSPASCRRSMHTVVSAGESWKSFAFLIHNRHELNTNIWK